MARKKRSAKKRAKRESRVKRSRVAKRTARREKRDSLGHFTKRKGGSKRRKSAHRKAPKGSSVVTPTKGMVCIPVRKKRKGRKGASRAARCSAAGRGLAIHKYHPRKVGRRAASLDARILERCKKLGDQLSAVLDGR